MRFYIPPERLKILDSVLQYDSELQEISRSPILTLNQRFWINQERGQILRGNKDYQQYESLEILINSIVIKIKNQNWKPKIPLEYD